MPWSVALSVLLLGSGTGCSSDLLGSAALPIAGGDPDPGHPEVVLLLINASPIEGGEYESENICTGTVIAPRVVISNAHCLQPTKPGKKLLFEVDGKCCAEAESVIAHEGWRPSREYRDDIGLALLKEPVTVAPATLLTTSAPVVGTPLVLVGYGRSAPNDPDTRGVKRFSDHKTIATVGAGHFTVLGVEGNTLQGDSGGPVFASAAGAEVIIGLQSHAEADNSIAYNVRVDEYADWITSALIAAGIAIDIGGPATPLVHITSPQLGAQVEGELEVSVEVTADNPIARLEVLVDGGLVATLETPPYTTKLTLADGPHRVVAVAHDSQGMTGAAEVSVGAPAAAAVDGGVASDGGPERSRPELNDGCSIGASANPRGSIALLLALLLTVTVRRRAMPTASEDAP